MSGQNNPQNSTPHSDIQIPMDRLVLFVRQLSHDLRNHLNAAELQSAYIAEIADNAELKDEVKRLRTMISEAGASLQKLAGAMASVRLTSMPYGAADFVEDLQQKLTGEYPEESSKVEWKTGVNDAVLEIDPQLLQPAMLELFANAFRHERGEGKIAAEAGVAEDHFLLTIREPKSGFNKATENWGAEPLVTVSHGHYGLGLQRARAIIEAHKGQLRAHYDPSGSLLVTTVRLPLAQPDAG